MTEEKEELHKDKECVYCKKMFDCKGKPKGVKCINFEEDKQDERMGANR